MRLALVAALVVCACAPAPPPPVTTDGGVVACEEGAAVLPGLLVNARELGALPTPRGPVACGRLFRSAAVSSLPDDGCTRFAQLGVKTVIDLRTPSERLNVPEAACVTATVSTVLAPMPIPSSVSPADYLADLHADDAVRALFATLADAAAYPVLFHCTYGRDRSGVAAALVLLTLGADRDTIMRDYQRTAANGLSSFPASLDAVLDAIAAAGGIDAYLEGVGIPAERRDAVRALLLQ